jgi:ribonucleoside-diphosphate reductase alpha chain
MVPFAMSSAFPFVPTSRNDGRTDLLDRLFHEVEDFCPMAGYEAEQHHIAQVHRAALDGQVVVSSAMLARLFREDDNWQARGVACTAWPLVDRPLDSAGYFALHRLGTGIGFDISHVKDPVASTIALNNLAVKSVNSGAERRHVGDSVTLDIHHPRVLEFINIRRHTNSSKWRLALNVKINASEVLSGQTRPTLNEICDATIYRGDPGVLFWDRYQERNPTPLSLPRIAVAPCAEVALSRGEGCIFGYINVNKLYRESLTQFARDLESLAESVTYFLDVVVALLSQHSGNVFENLSKSRRIGLGVCGFADLLRTLSLNYGDDEAKDFASLIASTLQIGSKMASTQLAHSHGPCAAFHFPDCKYKSDDSPLIRIAATSHKSVSAQRWAQLDDRVRLYGLRNMTTVVFPPSGKSSAFALASPGIEPFDPSPRLSRRVALSSAAANVSWKQQLEVAAAFSSLSDEAVSKTVTFPKGTNSATVEQAIVFAADQGLCGFSGFVYDH